ncbi:MAG: TonB-dependent receptor [Acidobacteriota bacterium]
MSRSRSCAIFLYVVFLACGAALSQQPSATITGTVTDPQGAVIPGATIVATYKDKGYQRTVASNAEGMYVIADLPVGSYVVKITAPGFETKISESAIQLRVGQTITLDASLKVDPLVETVDLIGEMSSIDLNTSKVDSVIADREIENLPLNGRNFLELALLTPGNSPAPNFDPTKANTVVISSAGQLGRGGNVMIDGTDNNDDVVGGPLVNISQDAVAEFQIVTNRFSAESGRSGSSIVNVVTKSGTNSLRGSAAFFERDRRLQGLPATTDRTLPAPPFDRQQYSFTLGGPIVKDKAFFFGALEFRDQDGAIQVRRRVVETRSFVNGFAEAPLKDVLLNTRLDLHLNDTNDLNFRYTFEDIEATDSSKLDRAIGSASYRQNQDNRFHAFQAGLTSVLSPAAVNSVVLSVNNFDNDTQPVLQGIQYTFPSLLDGSSFRIPQATKQDRVQVADSFTLVRGGHTLKFGGEEQSVSARIGLGVFRQGRVEFIQDFANADRNNDGWIDDNDLLFIVTLRSQFPNRDLVLPNIDNTHVAFFVQDDWRIRRNLTLNLGIRYQVDTNEKNISGYADRNPLVEQFYHGTRKRDLNNFAPRVGFNFSSFDDRLSIHGGYGIYYDRLVLELITLERGLDGRALPVAVRAGNAITAPNGTPVYLDQDGRFVPGAPVFGNPFTGFVLPGAGASGINIIANDMQNPMVQQSDLGIQWEFADNFVLRADYLHNFGTHFVIGRTIGVVNNPVVGGPDRVVNLESSAKTFYDGLLVSVEKRFAKLFGFRASYTLSKSFNYANDDQIPFSNGPIDPNDLHREFGPAPNDQRQRFVFAGTVELPYGFRVSPILTLASGVPMDILLPDASMRLPQLQRNAGGRLFKNVSELNAFITQVNSHGGVNGSPLPLAPADARFNDGFSSLDLRLSKALKFGDRFRLEPIVEVFNVFNTTNILGRSNTNYSGFGNVLGAENFGRPVTTAGGVFGSGGPRAFQIAGRFSF